MSKQSHKYITDVWNFPWGPWSEIIWPEPSNTRMSFLCHSCYTEGFLHYVEERSQRGHARGRYAGYLTVPADFASTREK